MPPTPRPPHPHQSSSSQPYSRPKMSTSAIASSSRHSKKKLIDPSDPDMVSSQASGTDGKKGESKKAKKKKKRSKSNQTLEVSPLVTTQPSPAITSHIPEQVIQPKIDKHKTTLARLSALTAPSPNTASHHSRSILTPSKLRHEPASTSVSASAKGSRSKKDELKIKVLSKQVMEAERTKEEMRKRIQALEKEVNEKKKVDDQSDKIRELEEALEKQRSDIAVKDKVIEQAERAKEEVQEAMTCRVCMEPLQDPHILSCGHIACQECLRTWFRQPNAYLHAVSEPITPDTDLSHRSKTCHTCRTVITHRPARMFHLRDILAPFGIEARVPTQSQAQVEPGSMDDPWLNTFPATENGYKLFDDGIYRCPDCFEEIEYGHCNNCDFEFSESDGDDEFPEFDGELDSDPENAMIFAGTGRLPVNTNLNTAGTAERRYRTTASLTEPGPRPPRQRRSLPPSRLNPGPNRRRRMDSAELAMRDESDISDGDIPPDLANVLDIMAEDSNSGISGEDEDESMVSGYDTGSDLSGLESNESEEDEDFVGGGEVENVSGALTDEDDYGGSFIDDGSVRGEEEESEDGEGDGENGEVEEQVGVEEIRRRRVDHYSRAPRSVEIDESPEIARRAPARRRGRVVVDPDSD